MNELENSFPARILPQRRLFSFLAPKVIPPLPTENERKIYPEETCSNPFSLAFFWWLVPILKVGYSRTLQPEDLFVLTDRLKVDNMYERYLNSITKIKSKFKSRLSGRLILILSVLNTFRLTYTVSCIYYAFSAAALTLNPLLTRHLINFVENKANGTESSIGKGIGYAIGTAAIVCLSGFLQNHSFQKSLMVGAKCKSILTKAVIVKSFQLSERSKHDYPSAKISSMLGTDLSRIDLAIGFFPILLAFPIPIVIAIVILIVNIGLAGLVGVALLAIFILGLGYTLKVLVGLRKKIGKHTDDRISFTQEVLQNLRMIKLYSWEAPYFKKIECSRNLEMRHVLKMQAARNLIMATAMSFTTISSMVAFLVLYGINDNGNAANIFSSLALFNVLSQQVYVLPLVTTACTDAFVAMGRISTFLESEEFSPSSSRRKETTKESCDYAIEIDSGDFEWEDFQNEGLQNEEHTKKEVETNQSYEKGSFKKSDNGDENKKVFEGLHNINLKVAKNELIILTGTIGCGKTSFLNAIMGFMPCKAGIVSVDGSLAFCNQPWIQNATVKENILFGSEFDKNRYNQVLTVCNLDMDLENFQDGDNTEIGERGITLSGGQKSRINLARAVYADKDIILLDDVLSAVDAKVGKSIMSECLQGYLKGKTRILATHQISLIGYADRIVFFNGDGTVDVGTLLELTGRNNKFSQLMTKNTFEKEDEEAEDQETVLDSMKQKAPGITKGALMITENKAVNGLGLEVYKNYLHYGSGKFTSMGWIAFYLVNTILATFCQLFSNTWLTFWIEQKFRNKKAGFYIGLYVMFSLLAAVFLVNELLSLVYLSNTASRVLHMKGITRILHSPMSFIDTTPTGRILNRFSRDTEVLDNEISNQLRITSFSLASIIGVIILCIIYLPWFAIAVPFLAVVFVGISSFYQASAREIKRLDAVNRSFVYSSFGEILSGMDTLKIYNVEGLFVKKLELLIDKMNEAYFLTITNQRWLSVCLNVISTIFTVIITLLCVCSVFNISAASVGLLLSYVLQITSQLNQLMRSITQVENQMNSTERLSEYAFKLKQEAPYLLNDNITNAAWPINGTIVFDDVSFYYRPELPLVLKHLTFKVESNEKVGICGRTGAGKSSIMSALFRLAELSEGSIIIDNVDISKIGLHALRSKLSIIPQDPVLFKGNIRGNLDPFDQSNEEEIISALINVGLVTVEDALKFKSDVFNPSDHKFHPDHLVEIDGVNYSLGEKQLISFARALVRNSKILILDEATSSVDYETDEQVQESIANEFNNCTILCIAHRLRTILNYDKILVMDEGSVVEYDTPINLFKAHDSLFRDMCQKSQITEKDFY